MTYDRNPTLPGSQRRRALRKWMRTHREHVEIAAAAAIFGLTLLAMAVIEPLARAPF